MYDGREMTAKARQAARDRPAVLPSGSVVLVRPAARSTVTWAKDAVAVKRRIIRANPADLKAALNVLDSITILLRITASRRLVWPGHR